MSTLVDRYRANRSEISRLLEGALHQEFQHPQPGPDGSPLYVDLFYAGPHTSGLPSASKIVTLMCGTHGVEYEPGAAAIIALLRSGAVTQLPPDVGLAIVHAVNPWGACFGRRVNEQNVDLNRSWGAEQKPSSYAEFADALLPRRWSLPAILRLTWRILRAGGLDPLKDAVSVGQSTHTDGLFFNGGGQPPPWSLGIVQAALEWLHGLPGCTHILIDLHTGLPSRTGEFAEFYCMEKSTDTPAAQLAQRILDGKVNFPTAGQVSSTSRVTGDLLTGAATEHAGLCGICVEFPTVHEATGKPFTMLEVMLRLLAENVAYQRRAPHLPHATDRLRELFAPRNAAWQKHANDVVAWVYARAIAELNV